MILYELYTGAVGESYERCYIWASDKEEALRLAFPECQKEYPGMIENDLRSWEITVLFDAQSLPFCTRVSDSGFDMEKE